MAFVIFLIFFGGEGATKNKFGDSCPRMTLVRPSSADMHKDVDMVLKLKFVHTILVG